jgi:RecA/RadA recombinase
MKLETGIGGLDVLLGGGVLTGTAILVYGNPGSGKSSLAMTVAANIAKRFKDSAIGVVVDTEAAWGSDRLPSIFGKVTGSKLDPEDFLKIYGATSMGEQHKVIVNIIPRDLQTLEVTPKIFIVDSLVCHYHSQLIGTPTTFLASKARELQGKLSLEIQTLLKLANSYSAFVLLTSWVKSAAAKSFQANERKEIVEGVKRGEAVYDIEGGFGARGSDTIGGQHLLYMSKTVLRMCATRVSEDTRAIVLEKSLDQRSMRGVFVKLGDDGISGGNEVFELSEMMRRSLLEDM